MVLDGIEAKLGYPIFVKPANAGSASASPRLRTAPRWKRASKSPCVRTTRSCLRSSWTRRRSSAPPSATPMTRPPSPRPAPGEILAGAEFYTYDDKYKNGVSQTVIPAHLSRGKARRGPRRSPQGVSGAGLLRPVPLRLLRCARTGRVLCNELNTAGLTSISMYPKLMEHEGYSYPALVDKLLTLAVHRRKGAY